MRILLDIDGTITSWDTVSEHGFGPAKRPYDPRTRDLIRVHDVALFSQNPEIEDWAELLGCAFIIKPAPGSKSLELTGYDALIDDMADQFSLHCPEAALFFTLDEFFRTHPLA